MSWADEFLELMRKKKEEEEEEEEITLSEYTAPVTTWDNPFTAMSRLANSASSAESVAPVKEEEEEDEKWYEGWFQKGAFDDGYQFGDITKSILGSTTDIREDIGAGLIGMGEKALDALAWMGNAYSKGQYYQNGGGYNITADQAFEQAHAVTTKATEDFIKKDLYDEEKVARAIITNPFERLTGIDVERSSVFDDKSDSLAQSGGQLLGTMGLQAVGVPWWLTTGATAFGSEAENALNQGATFSEAGASGLISAGAEILTEKLSGGIKFGGKTLDDVLLKPLTDKISSKVLKTLVNVGIDAVGEGGEEIISQVFSNLGSSLYREEDLGTILASEEAFDEYIESFIGGMALGGVGGVSQAIQSNGKNTASELTQNEQAVVDKVYEDAIKEAEKEKKLTSKEKAKIYDEVLEQMEKGYISTDTIEEVLGGETYKSYRDTMDSEDALMKEYDELGDLKESELTVKQRKRLNELEQQLEEMKTTSKRTEFKDRLGMEVSELVKGDRLSESYNERSRRGKAFEADISKYDEKQRKTIQKAIDSGILNNTRRTHEFVDMVAKITADKGVLFDFTNNEKLKTSGFAVDGKFVNGFVTKDGVTINVNSAKSLNSIVGHEITHVLEGTEVYTELQSAIVEYAKTKGDYQGRYDALTKLYANIEGANIDNELTADLVGDYLFTDTDFIKNLSVNNRNVFQKIWDEVKYLAKVATAGSKEARELAKVQRAFEKAYREAGKAAKDTKYSLDMVDAVQPKSDKWSRTHTTEEAMARFPNMWNVAAEESEVRNPTQITSTVNSYRKIYNFLQSEGFDGTILDASSGLGYGTRAGIEEYGFNVEDIEPYPDKSYKPKHQDYSALDKQYDVIISNAVLNVLPQDQRDALAVKMGKLLNEGGRLFVNVRGKDVDSLAKTGKNIHLGNMEWIETVKGSYQKGFTKPELVAYLQDALGDGFTVKPTNMFGAVSAVVTKNGGVKYSVSDSDGKQLTKGQQEYFKDSKIRDAEGNLKVMHHGSGEAFTVFDRKKAKSSGYYGSGFYFTDSDSHAKQYGNTYDVYLNITNPLQDGTKDITKEQLRKFVEAIADNEDYGIDNYGYGATVDSVVDSVYGKSDFAMIMDINASCVGNMVEAIELFNEVNGTEYNGIVAATETVAFYPEQIKRTDNTHPTSDSDIRFSLSEAVEETKELMAIHNLYSNELPKALALGGMPMPSIAVLKAQQSHDAYGDVSLIFPKDTIDPKKSRDNKIYGGDAWTPVYPSIEYKVNAKAQKAIEAKVDSLVPYELQRKLGYVSLDYDNMSSDINRYNGDLTQAYLNNYAMQYAYLVDNGFSEQLPMTEKDLDGSGRFKNDLIVDVVEKLGRAEVERLANESISHNDALIADLMDMANENAKKKYAGDSKLLEVLRNRPLYTEKNFGFAQADSIIRAANRYVQYGLEQTVDYAKAKDIISNAVDKDAYQKWLGDLFSGVVEKEGIRNNADYYTPSGNRRSWEALHWENTLENVLKVMKSQNQTGQGFFGGASIFGVSNKDYGSIEEVKADSDRLQTMPEEEYEELKSSLSNRLADIANAIKDPNERNRFIALDRAVEEIVDAVRTSKNKSSILRNMQKWNKRVTPEIVDDIVSLVNDIANMPTGYFEAKPQRAVGFDEVAVFVIPRNADVNLKQELLNRGYSIAEYDPDVEGDRQKVVNQFEEYKFSLSDVGQQPKQYGRWNVRGEDIALAPVAENATPTETPDAPVGDEMSPAEVFDNSEMFPDEQTPGMDELMAEAQGIMNAIEAYESVGDHARAEQLVAEYEAIMEKVGQMERTERQRVDSLTEEPAPPEMEAPLHIRSANANPFASRDWYDLGNRKVKAFMSEHPEVTPFFQEMAGQIGWDLADSVKAERWYNDQLHYDSGGEKGFGGNSRMTSDQIAEMLDDWHMSYADIEKGIQSIMDGKADNAPAKRLEIMLDRMLRNGYKDFHTGKMVEPNQEYIDTLNGIQANEDYYGAFDDLVAHGDEYAPLAVSKTETTTERKVMDAPVAEKYEAIKPKPTKEPRMAKATAEEQAKSAKILFGEHQTPKQKSAWKWAKEHIFRKGAVFEDLSLKTGNRELQARFDNIRRAESRAQTFIGKGKGQKALVDVRKEVEKAGKTEAFNYYLYHLHNVDRMTLEQRFKDVPNKSVFGDAVTAEVSQKAAMNLETLNPEFKAWAEDVYAINKHLRQMMVSEGIISQETADLWQTMYPHYVPISRADYEGLNVNVPLDTKRTGVNAPIKKAQGGNSDFYNVFDTMGSRIEQTFKAIAKNRFGVELKNTLGTAFESEAADIDSVLESMDNHEELLQEGKNGESPSFTVFQNGERVKFAITSDMYDAMKPSQFTYTNEALRKVNNVRRDILTTYSPTFMLTNPIKDVQDILLNSQHPARTYAAIPEAIKSVIAKDQWYQERMENGGSQDSYFDGQKKTFKKEDGLFKKVMGFVPSKIQAANEIIEQVPRMAEYIASRKMGRSVDVSMLDAARVTTNFGAAGDFTNMLNRNGFTFLGASVEGFNQQVRNVREAKADGAKGWAKLAGKYLAAGLPALLLNHALWDDDEEYEELSDYVKQNYYVIAKTEDGKFIRIPKGRAVAVIQDAFTQMENLITGDDEADFGSFAQLVINNLAPNNPLDNNIIAPIGQALTNKTWYGDDLVPTRLQDVPDAEQFDETTDSFSKWLGEVTEGWHIGNVSLEISPYKANYVLDQYSGGLGDMVLPYLTPAADGGGLGAAMRDKFVTDPVLKNQNVTDFYDKMDELTKNANSMYATDEDVLMSKYMSSVNSELSKLYQQKREIQNSDLSDAEKYAQVRDIQQQIVDLARNGLGSYEDVNIEGVYATVGDQQFRWYEPGEDSEAEPGWKKLTADQIEKQDEVTKGLGITPSEYWSNKGEYDFQYEYPEKYDFLTKNGVTYDDYANGSEEFKDAWTWASKNPEKFTLSKAVASDVVTYRKYTSDLYDIKADKDEDGKSITGSRKEKVIDYINNMDADYGEKIILFKSEYPADDTYNYDIIDYLNSREDISYEEMETILKELGFQVDSDGNITWD